MYYTEHIVVVFKNWKGERVEVPVDSGAEAKIVQEKLKAVDYYSWVEHIEYMPLSTVAKIRDEIGSDKQ